MHKFNYQNAQFDYEPYPICYIPNFLNETDYKELCDTYPSLDMFKFKPALGNKYSLAEKNNRDFYFNFLKENKAWKDFYEQVKTKDFIKEVFEFLRGHGIDQNIRRFWYTREMSRKRRSIIGRVFDKKLLRSRFEFSLMSANGGNILPHTDATRKLVTLVLTFIKPGEWKEEWGGGTNIDKPKDITKIYNNVNFQLPFEEVTPIKTFPFNPNQCVLFVKTYNSWHSVSPMTGPESALRKTITINIENIS